MIQDEAAAVVFVVVFAAFHEGRVFGAVGLQETLAGGRGELGGVFAADELVQDQAERGVEGEG